MSEFRERFWDRLCGFQWQLFMLLVFDVALLVIALASLPFVEAGTATGVIVWVDIGIFLAALVPLAYVQYRCRRRQRDDGGY